MSEPWFEVGKTVEFGFGAGPYDTVGGGGSSATIEPFALYNFTQQGASTATFVNQGSQAAKFDIPRSVDNTYWGMSDPAIANESSIADPMNSVDDIDGSWCDAPISMVVSTAAGGEMFGPAWRCTGPDGGWAWRVFFEYLASGACYVEFHVQQALTTPTTTQPAAIFEWTGSSSADITMVVTVDIANNTQPTLFIAGGGSPSPTNNSVYGTANACSFWDAPNVNETQYALYGSGGIKGIGFFRGAGTQLIADEWHAYDWATEPGFASTGWTDVTEWVRQPMTINRGRSSEYATFAPGTATVVLDNRDRRFDPAHAAGPYFGDLNPMTPVRIRHTYNTVEYTSFRGFALGFPQAIGKGYTDGEVPVRLIDAFRILGQTDITGSAYITDILDTIPDAYWPFQETVGVDYLDLVANRVMRSWNGDDERRSVDGPLGATSSVRAPRTGNETNQVIDPNNPITMSAALGFNPKAISFWMNVESLDDGELATPAVGLNVRVANGADDFINVEIVSPSIAANDLRWQITYSNTADAKDTNVPLYGPTVTVGLHHVAVAADATTLRFYLNGTLAGLYTLDAGPASSVYDVTVLQALDSSSTVSHLAAWATAPAAATWRDHYIAGMFAYGHPTGERTGERIGRILDEIDWPLAERDIATGDTAVGPYADSGTALSYCRSVEEAEAGLFFVARDGKVTFRDRQWQFARASVADFGDDPADLQFRDIRPDANTVDNIRNTVTVTWGNGQVTVADDTSLLAYGPNRESISARLISSQATAQQLAAYIVRTRKDPATRIEFLKVLPRRDPAALFPVVLDAELGDLITVTITPLNVGSSTVYTLAIQGIRHAITRRTWETDFYLAPADTGPYFTVGDATLGRIGAAANNRIPY